MRKSRLPGTVALLGFLLASCQKPKRDRFVIPDQAVGWIEVTFGVPNTPPLRREDGFRLVPLGKDLRYDTADPIMDGEEYRDEYLCESSGPRKKVLPRMGGSTRQLRTGVFLWRVFVDCS
jgi:hypothetical protein